MGERISNGLPEIKRFITTHNERGQGVFTRGNLDNEDIPWEGVGGIKNFGLGYTSSSFPTKLQNEEDVRSYEAYLQNKPGMAIKGGSVLRYVDYAPDTTSPAHQTMSLDYGVVIEGQIELFLDSGEKRLMNRGDVSIMRATRHGWRNPSKTQWCRMLFVLLDAEAPIVNGEKLEEDYGHSMPGIKSTQ